MPIYELKIVRQVVSDDTSPKLKDADKTVDYALKYCFNVSEFYRERVFAIALDRELRPLGHHLLAVGGQHCSGISKNDVCLFAAITGCWSVILVHNHPTGSATPSPSDMEVTYKVKKALSALGCNLLDHIVIGEETYFSFSEEKLVKRQCVDDMINKSIMSI